MIATADLSVETSATVDGSVLPSTAVQQVDDVDVVFIEEASGHFVARPVTVTARSSERVQLSDGVSVGERVVMQGAFALKSELDKSELGEGHAH
jgi:cobalt-zinc-cadmium efflux system membrane fusion protein